MTGVRTGETELSVLLRRCCGSRRWVDLMVESAPWTAVDDLLVAAERAFDRLERKDWLEAFAAHPRIGDRAALRPRSGARGATEEEDAARALAGREQAAAAVAPQATLDALAEGNRRYDERFGHLFLVFASGKSAEEMLGLLEARLGNEPDEELRIASGEQRKITRQRLRDGASPIVAAARDQRRGEPAEGPGETSEESG